MISAEKFVEQARTGNYLGIPYSDMDCQAFVEKVLADCGLKKDWRGSNHMWRDALSEKHPIEDLSAIPAGAWLFTVKHDGGEVDRGYLDDEGNAKHVGIYLGDGEVMHSTSAGNKCVQMDVISSSRWTHWGLCKYITYGKPDLLDLLRVLGQQTLYDIYTAAKQLWG